VLLCVIPIVYAAQPIGDYDTLALINPTIKDEEWNQNFNKLRTYINYQSREDQTLKGIVADLEGLSKDVRAIFETLPIDNTNLNALFNQSKDFERIIPAIDSFNSTVSRITFMLPGKRECQRKILEILATFKQQIITEYNKISTQPLDLFTTAIAKEEEAIRKGSETLVLDHVINVDILIWNKAIAQLQKFITDNSSGDNRLIDSLTRIVTLSNDVINFIKLPLPEKSEQIDEFRFTISMIGNTKAELIQSQKNSAFVQAGCKKLLLTCISLIEDIAKNALNIFVNQKRQQFQN
jgi:hypothetical protein